MKKTRAKLWKGLQGRLASGELKLDVPTLESHSGDKWFAARLPEAVAIPRSVKSVSSILQFAYRHDIPVTPRGAGSVMLGGVCRRVVELLYHSPAWAGFERSIKKIL